MLCFPEWNPYEEIPESPRQCAVTLKTEYAAVKIAQSQEPGRDVLNIREKKVKRLPSSSTNPRQGLPFPVHTRAWSPKTPALMSRRQKQLTGTGSVRVSYRVSEQ